MALTVSEERPESRYFDERGRIIAPGIDRPGDMTPISVKLPEIAQLKSLTNAELLELSQRYGVYSPWSDLLAQNARYVEEFMKIPVGAPGFWEQVERITNPESGRRAILGLARASQRNYNQILATNGDEDRILVRVGEGDENMCDGCQAMEGAEGTYAEHDAIGLPGSQECGQYCRCMLIPVDGDRETRGGEMGITHDFLTERQAENVIINILEDSFDDNY